MQETKEPQVLSLNPSNITSKMSGIQDIKLFSADNHTPDNFLTPSNAIISKGMKISIRDLQKTDPENL